ncbi:MAG: DUF998 domain-containing protein [Candidatus Thorarchaeota archaeon]
MSEFLSKENLTPISGFLVIVFYCIFMLISWAFYPFEYAPWSHYLSRLGNFNNSPFGAYFYNWGCILTGLALFPFFIGLYIWYSANMLKKLLVVIGQGLGVSSAIALILIGVFSENLGEPHMTASSTFFLINFFTLIVLGVALALHTEFPILLGLYGIFVSISSLLMALTIGGPITEWYTVFASLLFVGLVSFRTRQVFHQS